jgi:IclR family pca regulon transcriptional regulator
VSETFVSHAGDPEFMLSLARGMTVLERLAEADGALTIAEVGRRAGVSRAAARRVLYTLAILGYVRAEPGGFVATARPLALNNPLLSPSTLARRAQPLMDRLRDELGESCSLGVIDQDRLRYLARSEAYRVMSVGLRVGSELPLYATSMGRVLLAACDVADVEAYLARIDLRAFTARTETTIEGLRQRIEQARSDGFAVVDQELEIGLRSIAVPIMHRGGVVAALNIGTASARVSLNELRTRFRSALSSVAAQLTS